jgi:hypothetical protein
MGRVRRIFERFGFWIAFFVLAVVAVLQGNWVFLAIVGVATVGFALMRPLDRRANQRTRGNSTPR